MNGFFKILAAFFWIMHTTFALEAQALSQRGTVTIPLVFHVVWHQNQENITEAQILSQIEVLNVAFSGTDPQLSIVPAAFQARIANMDINFCLAKTDPDGHQTEGITRRFSSLAQIGNSPLLYEENFGTPAWDPTRYINVWVADLGGTVNGKATMPNSSPLSQDGIVIDPRYVGNMGLAATSMPYHLGKTMVHEMGHYFNLLHPWGNGLGGNCNGDDFIDDTPSTSETYLQQCPTSNQIHCGTIDPWMNYMFYTNDACLAFFTIGQKERVWEAIDQYRSGLTQSEHLCIYTATSEISPSPKAFYAPFGKYIHIEHGESVSVWGADGRMWIKQQALENHQLSLSNLPKGSYTCSWIDRKQVFAFRFMVL